MMFSGEGEARAGRKLDNKFADSGSYGCSSGGGLEEFER